MTPKRGIFESVGGARVQRSAFNLSHEHKLTCKMGQLVPVLLEECVPGDRWKIGNEMVMRFQPMVAPILHEVNVFVHYFFVPYRLLWAQWEEFITKGEAGTSAPALPRWVPEDVASMGVGTLWDYMGFPSPVTQPNAVTYHDYYPVAFPINAYYRIFNEFYRDQNITPPLPAGAMLTADYVSGDAEVPLMRAWEKDYFTSSLPDQQKGTAPALPVTGHAEWDSDLFEIGAGDYNAAGSGASGVGYVGFGTGLANDNLYANYANVRTNANNFLNNNDLISAGIDIQDIRAAFQIQRWLERNQRAGSRYTEFLRSHFCVSPRDERLQRPEYIGGSKSPVIVSEVLQTSETTTGAGGSPQGTMAGHGMSINQAHCGTYDVQEFGLIMGIMSVLPRTNYQQGINRQWLKQTTYDYFFPEFANLSEQAVTTAEVYFDGAGATNPGELFGYQGRYNELRYKPSVCSGLFKSTLNYWHLGRIFASKPELNDDFIYTEEDDFLRIFAVQTEDYILCSFGNILTAVRPLPINAEPGLIDHV